MPASTVDACTNIQVEFAAEGAMVALDPHTVMFWRWSVVAITPSHN